MAYYNSIVKKYTCDACDTCYSCEGAYLRHLKSKIHFKRLKEVVDHHETHGVFIGNISQNIIMSEVLEYLCKFGQLEKCVYYKGCGQFLFKEEKSAKSVRSMTHEIGGQQLKVIPWRFCFVTSTKEREAEEEDILNMRIARALMPDLTFKEEVTTLRELIKMSDPSPNSEIISKDLACTLQPLYDEISVLPFGSVFTGLAFKGSDMDFDVDSTCSIQKFEQGSGDWRINLQVTKPDLNAAAVTMETSNLFSNVQVVAEAKVPIIKFVHTLTGTKCDISFTGVVGILNSRLIKYYISLDPRVEPLLVITKYWNKYFQFKKCGLTSYGIVMMTLYYLMQLEDSIIPPVAYLKKKSSKRLFIDGWDCSLNLTEAIPNNNTESILNLLCGFFEFYAQFDVGMNVTCPLMGQEIPKVNFMNTYLLPPEMLMYKKKICDTDIDFSPLKIASNICVQDPFYLNFNITSRMETQDVFKLQSVCWSSAHIIKVGQGRYSSIGILKRLFDRQIDLSWQWNNTFIYPEIWINVGTYVSPKLEFNPIEVQFDWYILIYGHMKEIFQKICRFETEEVPYFRQAVEDEVQTRVCDPFSHGLRCCSEHPNLIKNRNTMATFINNRFKRLKISWFKFEEVISEYLIDLGGPVETVQFYCFFHFHKNPTRVSLELRNINSTDFEGWVSFLNTTVPLWLAKAML